MGREWIQTSQYEENEKATIRAEIYALGSQPYANVEWIAHQ